MTYLTEKRGLSKDIAKDVYELFGGRIKNLQNAATKLESGISFESMLKLYLFAKITLIIRLPCSYSNSIFN
jgi:hypothetical protein